MRVYDRKIQKIDRRQHFDLLFSTISQIKKDERFIENYKNEVLNLYKIDKTYAYSCLSLFNTNNLIETLSVQNKNLANENESNFLNLLKAVSLNEKKEFIDNIGAFNHTIEEYIKGNLQQYELKKYFHNKQKLIRELLHFHRNGNKLRSDNIGYFYLIQQDFQKSRKLLNQLFKNYDNIIYFADDFVYERKDIQLDFSFFLDKSDTIKMLESMTFKEHLKFARLIQNSPTQKSYTQEFSCKNHVLQCLKNNLQLSYAPLYCYAAGWRNLKYAYFVNQMSYSNSRMDLIANANYQLDINEKNIINIVSEVKSISNALSKISINNFNIYIEKGLLNQQISVVENNRVNKI